MPSDSAHRLHAMLRVGPGGLCTRCAGAALALDDRWELLKVVRELIMMSVVLCRLERCGMCDRTDSVISLRKPRAIAHVSHPTSPETTDRICPRCHGVNVFPTGHNVTSATTIRLTYRCFACLEEFAVVWSRSSSK